MYFLRSSYLRSGKRRREDAMHGSTNDGPTSGPPAPPFKRPRGDVSEERTEPSPRPAAPRPRGRPRGPTRPRGPPTRWSSRLAQRRGMPTLDDIYRGGCPEIVSWSEGAGSLEPPPSPPSMPSPPSLPSPLSPPLSPGDEVEVPRASQSLEIFEPVMNDSISVLMDSQSLADSSNNSLPGVSDSMNQPEEGTPSLVDSLNESLPGVSHLMNQPEVGTQSPAVSFSDSLSGVSHSMTQPEAGSPPEQIIEPSIIGSNLYKLCGALLSYPPRYVPVDFERLDAIVARYREASRQRIEATRAFLREERRERYRVAGKIDPQELVS